MTAVQAAARAFACFILGAVLILAGFAAMLWVDFGPQDWAIVWLLVMFAVVAGVTLAWTALYPPDREPDLPPLTERQVEAARRLAVPRHRKEDGDG